MVARGPMNPARFVGIARAAGARGYVSKRRAEREVVPAARAVLAGRTYVEGRPETGPAPADGSGDPVGSLSDREFEVFLLLGEGYAPRDFLRT